MSSSYSPECWHTTTLGSVIELVYGKSLPAKVRDGVSFPVFGSNGVVGKHSIPLVEKPGLIVGRKGSFGEVHISEEPFFPIDTTYYVDNFHGQPIRYWFYQLRFLPLNQLNRATAIPGLNREDAYSQEIVLPPLAEQKVIAKKLDTLLAQVENTKARLERIPQILKRFRQSVLAAAVSGRLTEGEGLGDESWAAIQLANLCTNAFDGPFGSKLKSSDYTDGGVGVVRLENIRHLRFDQSKETFISEDKYRSLIKNKLEKNDILFSSFVDEEVRACLFPFETRRFINKADCFCLRIDQQKALPKFVLYMLTSQVSYAQIKEHVQGVTRPRVNLKILKSLEFPVPPLQKQAEVVGKVNQLFAHADHIEQQVQAALECVNHLTQSILAKAFRGELTEQWRKENPELISGENSAEALLERIKAERAAMKPAKRTRKSKTNA